ncbi:hypothetical protein HXX76_012920 [Chlamydomonas incerta]|uniref:Uncharacterized protein n=1 Tax=Chlamydomonas incerta TaxID=51695 RepID=A0A835SQW1_CHLIN|nr:hypothetical protein HXX76_012920 [Chlamydomonas incerta]|eukprot:KAG2426604.1 hypothetical protein HXX76_012920 [Chlamydomonas incerta]
MQLSGLATGVLKPRIRPGDDSSWFSPPRGGRNLSRELRGLGVSAGGMGGGEVTKPEAPSRPVPATSTASTAAHPSISNHSGGSSGGGGWGGGSVTWTSSAGLAAATTTAATATATHAANATGPSASQPAAAPPSGTQPAVGCAGGHTTPDTATSALSSGACGDGAGGCGGKLGISAAYPAGSGSWGGAVSGDGAVGCRPAKEAASAAQLAAGRTQIPSADAPARATSSCSGPYAAAGGATESGAAEATSSRLRVAAAATAAEARADSGSHRAAQSCGEHRGAPPQQMQMLGSLQRFSPVKAGRAHREQLGTDVILTPVRRSARTSHKPTTPIGALLEMTNFAFVNNAFLND